MEKFTPKYSLKNISFPGKHDFVLSLTDKIMDFIKRMRWKAHFHLNPAATKEEQKPGARRLKSQRTPPSNSGLDQFENYLFGIIRKIEFMNSKNTFQTKMREDIERIRKSRKVWVRSDKSNNIYQVSPHEYERILNDKTTESCKLDHSDTITQIIRDAAKFAQKVNIIDKVGKLEEKSAYILVKDHKKNFPDKKQTRLINPSKTELGFVSKDEIHRITSTLLSSHKYNLWENSMDTIDWFRKIKDKKRSTFVQFVIIEFYPSITKELLVRSLNHATEYTDITEEEIEIILASRKSVLSDSRRSWEKKSRRQFRRPHGGL